MELTADGEYYIEDSIVWRIGYRADFVKVEALCNKLPFNESRLTSRLVEIARLSY